MKFETLMLRGLFAACFLVCGLTVIAMMSASPEAVRLAAKGSAAQMLIAAPTSCMLPPDGVVCPRNYN
jgi:hypothetical protein